MPRTRWIIGIVAFIIFLIYIWWAISTISDDDRGERVIAVQATPPNLPIELSSQCVDPGPPEIDVWRLDLRYPASESPVLIRFRDGATGPILFEKEFVTPGTYRDLVIRADTLVAVRVVNGKELDRNFHHGDNSVMCKPPASTTTTTTIPAPPPIPPSTTVPITPTTPTTGPLGIFISAVGTTCQKDVPVIVIEFGDQAEFNGRTATLTFIDLNGKVIEKRLTIYESNTKIVELYPGAAVDITTGEAVDWPGWKQNADGLWVEDPADALWRQGLTLLIEVNPSASTQVSYPPASSACANPKNPPVPGQPLIPPAR